jgi:hypothetical protein
MKGFFAHLPTFPCEWQSDQNCAAPHSKNEKNIE